MLWYWFWLSLSVFVVARLLPGIHLKSFWTAVVVAAVYGIVNFVLYKALVFLALPLVVLSLGLFLLIINAFLLWLTDKLVDDFAIRDFPTTIVAALGISFCNLIFNGLF
ncbi:phage holin family protein [Gallaecimonas sp. GXIMD4217]|uniref:phage holin family protein n=1 Tax=Gallaecimonas sp. GXIMD4217 TaxID=3131927 RepID=UPI00311B234B